MQPNAVGPLEISEDDVTASAPRVRALIISRLEVQYELVNFRINQDKEQGVPVDPRMLEIGLRICKELALHYRLYKAPVKVADEEDDLPGQVVDRAAAVESTLLELETKLRSNGA
jgi:hypothetical protein